MAEQSANPQHETTLKVLLVGDAEVGKSSLIRTISGEEFQVSYSNTIGIDFKTLYYDIERERVKVQIWDTAGQERFHTITKAYYRGAHGIILVYDITSEDSFLNVEKWIQSIQDEGPSNVRLMLLGNKLDLAKNWRAVTPEMSHATSQKYNMAFSETSAKSGENVQESFVSFVNDLKTFHDKAQPSQIISSNSEMGGEPIRILHDSTRQSTPKCSC